MNRHDVELLRRSVAMQAPGSKVALDRDQVLAVLEELRQLKQLLADLKRLANNS